MERKLILVTNDDGVSAQGINELTHLVSQLGDVVVVAPDTARSGAGCSITHTVPVGLRLFSETESIRVYACSGNPVDCVKLGLEQACPRRPDLLVSGINHGDNASCSIHYSGTMGAVIEGCLKDIPSVGYSLRTRSAQCDFTPYQQAIVHISRFVLEHGLPQGICLNVNFPEVHQLAGVRITRMARGNWRHEWVSAHHPHGTNSFWLTGEFYNLEPECDDTDYWALDHGYASITPIQLDMTAHHALAMLAPLASDAQKLD